MNAPARARTGDEPVDLGALDRSIGFALRLAQTRAYDQFFHEFRDTDVRPGEFTVIWAVSLNPGIRQGVLARRLNIKPAHMTKLVQRMGRKGLVSRTIPASDRRSVRLSLTVEGDAYLRRHRARFLAVHRAERIGLSDDELSHLLMLLNKLNFKETSHAHQS